MRARFLSLPVIALIALCAGAPARAWYSTDMTGVLPSLAFTMTRASDGEEITAATYKGKIVLLYFGYTSCPDVCPTTLFNISSMLKTLGKSADDVRVLFVTVDPDHDKLEALKEYAGSFAPQIEALRGTPDQLATLAKRYRVAYSVKKVGDSFEVTHGTAVYVFDRAGAIKLLFTGLAVGNTKLDHMTADLTAMVNGGDHFTLWRRIMQYL